MKKRAELISLINAARTNVLNLLNDGKMEEAKAESEKLEKLSDELAKTGNDAGVEGMKPLNGNGGIKMTGKERIQAIKDAVNHYLRAGYSGLTDAEKQLLKPTNTVDSPGQVETVTNPSRGSVLVGVEVADFVGRMDTGVYRLRDLVSEYFPKTKSGVIPLLDNPTAGLVQLTGEFPAGGITKGDVKFGSVEFSVNDMGLIIPVSNSLLEDATADVFSVLADQFARAQVVTEDNMILTAIDNAVAAVEVVTDWKDILKALNGTSPVGSPEKKIVTNTDGYNYLDTLVDEAGHPILTMALVDNPKRMFRGYEVIQLPNEILPTATPEEGETYGAIPFYVGSFRDGVYFIERKGMQIDYNPYSDSAFGRNAVDMRVVCRLDCKAKFASAVKKLTYTPSGE